MQCLIFFCVLENAESQILLELSGTLCVADIFFVNFRQYSEENELFSAFVKVVLMFLVVTSNLLEESWYIFV